MKRVVFIVCAIASAAAAQTPQYDLVLKGGHVIDAKNHRNGVMDVAIANGKVARVAPAIPAGSARRSVDCKGLYVTPGLVDIHVHVYAVPGLDPEGQGNITVLPDGFSFRSGVTTMVDAGTSGWRTFPDFKEKIIDHARTRVLAWLNIVAHGMQTPEYQQDVKEMDVNAAAECARKYPDIIVGFKTAHFAGPEWAALDGAIGAGKLTSLPVMVDYGPGNPARPFSEALRHMRAGDIYTHFYGRPRPLLDDQGHLRPEFAEARKRGVIFDVGHGAGSFLWRQAVPAIREGFIPDSISTDLHSGASNAGMKDILNVMSKFLAMGRPLDEVIAQSTWHPAREIHREELGNLSEGAPADVAVLRVLDGHFGFVDVNGARMDGTQKLEAELTIHNGKVEWDLNGITRDDWRTLPKNYGLQGDDSWDATLMGRPASVSTSASGYFVYAGGFSQNGSNGIYGFRFDTANGKLTPLGLVAETKNPTYFSVDRTGRFLYTVVNEQEKEGGVSAFSIDASTGKLTLLNTVPSRGVNTCYVTLTHSGKFALTANYVSGSVAAFPVHPDGRLGEASGFDQHFGKGGDPARQDAPHAHSLNASPDDRFVIGADLGTDQFYVYHLNADGSITRNAPPFTAVKPASGPRHFMFAPSGKIAYGIEEISSDTTVFSYDAARGVLHEIQTVSNLPSGFKGENTSADVQVHPSGKFVYSSNRGADTIAVFAVDAHSGKLTPVDQTPSRGKTPRIFALDPSGKWLIAANQGSGTLAVFRIDAATGKLTPVGDLVETPSPTCVKFGPAAK